MLSADGGIRGLRACFHILWERPRPANIYTHLKQEMLRKASVNIEKIFASDLN